MSRPLALCLHGPQRKETQATCNQAQHQVPPAEPTSRDLLRPLLWPLPVRHRRPSPTHTSVALLFDPSYDTSAANSGAFFLVLSSAAWPSPFPFESGAPPHCLPPPQRNPSPARFPPPTPAATHLTYFALKPRCIITARHTQSPHATQVRNYDSSTAGPAALITRRQPTS